MKTLIFFPESKSDLTQNTPQNENSNFLSWVQIWPYPEHPPWKWKLIFFPESKSDLTQNTPPKWRLKYVETVSPKDTISFRYVGVLHTIGMHWNKISFGSFRPVICQLKRKTVPYEYYYRLSHKKGQPAKNRGDYNRGHKNNILTKLCMIYKCEMSTLREGQIVGLKLKEILSDCSHQFPMTNILLRMISLLTSIWIHNELVAR